jgi:hypothetical protein
MSSKIEIKGKCIHIGEEKNGYQTFTIEDSSGEYPLILSFDIVEMSGYVSSREWQGRYFTSIRGSFSKIEKSNEPEPKQEEPTEDPFEDEAPF